MAVTVQLAPVRCAKCNEKFIRRRRQERVCVPCKPRWQVTRDQVKRQKSEAPWAIGLEGRILWALSQVEGGKKPASTMFEEARRALTIPGLESYAGELVSCAAAGIAGEPWPRIDQLSKLGAVWWKVTA
jgi:hypothetical protein